MRVHKQRIIALCEYNIEADLTTFITSLKSIDPFTHNIETIGLPYPLWDQAQIFDFIFGPNGDEMYLAMVRSFVRLFVFFFPF